MVKTFFKNVLVLFILGAFLSINLNANKYEMHKLELCKSTEQNQEILGIRTLCINNEKIIRKNLLEPYGGNNVFYETSSRKFSNIYSTVEQPSNTNYLKIDDKSGLVFTYDSQNEHRLLEIKTSAKTISIPYSNSEISFYYEKLNTNDVKISQIVINGNIYSITYSTEGISTISTVSQKKNLEEYISYTLTFNDKSQLLREVLSGTNIEISIKKYEYSIDGESTIVKSINPFGNIEKKVYDQNKNLLSYIDYNKLSTIWEYDTNNRKVKEIKANGTIIDFEYSTSNLVDSSVLKVIITSLNEPKVTQFFDELNRKTRTEKQGFYGRIIAEDILYDSQGRVSKYSIPYFKGENIYYIDFSYDDKNRVTSINKPGLNDTRLITTYEYNNINDFILIKYPDGKEENINSNNVNESETITYDILGNIKKITNESGTIVDFTYDILSRLVKKEMTQNNDLNNKETTNFVYDRSDNAVGKLSYVKSKDYKKEYYYDDLSRVKTNKTIIGNKVFTTQYTYTLDDKIETLITPDGFKIIHEYNDFGFLNAIKSPKLATVELDFDNLKELVITNLNDEFEFSSKYYDLEAKIQFYTLKKPIYDNLALQYASVNIEISNQLKEVSILLDETIVLLKENSLAYKSILLNLQKIRNSYLLPKLTSKNYEDNFKWLSEVFDEKKENYVSLSTKYIDEASVLLENIISEPNSLNDPLNIDSSLINYYTSQSKDINLIVDEFYASSTKYNTQYDSLKLGEGIFQNSAYLGMFDNSNYKYFYKTIDMDPLGRVTSEIFGNGLVTKKEYDVSSGNLIRITTGFNGSTDIKDVKYTYDVYNNLVTQYDVKNNLTKNYVYDLSNKLISASSVGSSFYSNIAYSYIDPSLSTYSFDSASNKFYNDIDNINIGLDNPKLIDQNLLQSTILYSEDNKSYKKNILNDSINNTIYKIDNTFKYEIKDGETNYKNLIYANDRLVAIHIEEDMDSLIIPNNYYLHQDLFGSIDLISNDIAEVEESFNYRPFGEKTDDSWTKSVEEENSITNLGFKGFEYDEFNLVDVNGYLYDPSVSKTFTNELFNSLDTNAKNFFFNSNPTKYMDIKLDDWFGNISSIFNIKDFVGISSSTLLNTEISRDISSISTNNNIHIGYDAPIDTSKIWYNPNVSGGLDIKISNGGSWEKVGYTGSLDKTGEITVSTLEKLNEMPCFYQDNGFVEKLDQKIAYKCSSSQKWELGGDFGGTYTVLDIATKYMDSLENSKINVTAPYSEFSGLKEFKKVSGYWIDITKNFVISDNVNSVLEISTLSLNSRAFIKKDDSSLYYLKKLNIPSVGDKLVYLTYGYDRAASDFDLISQSAGTYIQDTKNNKFFNKAGNVWTSTDNTIKLTSSSLGRDSFTNISSEYTYYSLINDCISSTCNGSTGTSYYAGVKEDNMHVFYESTQGNRKNNLIDAVPATSISDIYTRNLAAGIYTNTVYFKTVDNKNRLCYKTADNKYWLKNGVEIKTGNNLPPSRTCSDANYFGDYLVLSNRTQVTDWVDAPNEALVKVGAGKVSGDKYVHKVSNGKDFWTNNSAGDGQVSATEIFTKGDRSHLPTVTHSITALTKNLGSQERYTTSGIASSIDSSFKEWYYSSSGTRTSDLLDAKLCNSSASCYSINDVPKIIYNGDLLSKVNSLWRKNDTSYLVKKMDNTYHTDLTIINHAVGKASNGLYYDNGLGYYGKYNYNTSRSSMSYCSSIGMRLPTIGETRSISSSGVPSSPSGISWTTSCSDCDTDDDRRHYAWNGTGRSGYLVWSIYNHKAHTRCVK